MNSKDVDAWVASIRKEGQRPCRYETQYINPFKPSLHIFQSVKADYFVKIESDGYDPFYCYFQPCMHSPAPLVVHTPGYGGEMSMHPELAQYFNVLHINPLGYTTPEGKDVSKMTMDAGVDMWGEVYPDTLKSGGTKGYYTWLVNCVMAVEWAFRQECVLPGRVSFSEPAREEEQLCFSALFSMILPGQRQVTSRFLLILRWRQAGVLTGWERLFIKIRRKKRWSVENT